MNRTFEELVAIAESPDGPHGALSRDECLLATRQYAAINREALRREHAAGASGSNIVHLLSDTADTVVR
ncbi:MAG: hypothetical protein FJY92_03550, partial [Candidatus Hydrogenedentes bacterium]|nr:hypothetical protein [Candidatus Hydrogenedentota bacterium]